MLIAWALFWAAIFTVQWSILIFKIQTLKYKGKINLLLPVAIFIYDFFIMYMMASDSVILHIVAPLIETIVMVIYFVLFTKGLLFYNVMVTFVSLTLSNALIIAVLFLFPKSLYTIQVIDLEHFANHLGDNIFAGIVVWLVTLLVADIYTRIFKREYKGSQVWCFLILFLFFVFNYIRGIVRSEYNSESRYYVIAFMSALITLILLLAISYIYNIIERKRIEREQHQIKAMLDKIYDHYELMVRENRELRDLKHDMNKQLEIARRLSEKAGTSKAAREYLLELITEQSSYIGIPYSGNIDVDTILAMCFQQAQKRSIMLEMVVQPLDEIAMETTELIGLLSAVTDEIMDKCVIGTATPWIRINIRRRGKNTLFQIEYSVRKKWYMLKKVIFSIFFREPGGLKSDYLIKNIVEKYQAAYIKEEDEEKGLIAIML